MSSSIDVVLFDLGGVLVELASVEPMRELASAHDDEEVWRHWLTCPWVRAFERGDCSAEAFAVGIVGDWQMAISPEEFLERFQDWPRDPFPGAHGLVEDASRSVLVGCLSNMNALHRERHAHRWTFLEALDFRFLSFELGCLKPDQAIFERVAEALPTPRERVLFLDDNVINTDGAVDAGFRAVRVRGVDEARAALVAAGVMGGSGG